MGWSAGAGLGRTEQGLAAPVSDLLVDRSGRGGLGFRDAAIDSFLSDLPDQWDFERDPVIGLGLML